MKVGDPNRPMRVTPARETTTRKKGASKAASAATASGDAVSVMGIPEVELTPKVREAIMTLMAEVDTLRRDLEGAMHRIDELESLADSDVLLPVLNRRAFVRELTRIKDFGERYGLKASLIYIDLNDFKVINDKFGHAGGDKALMDLTAILKKNLRDSDVLGRLGGDEFGIILPSADEKMAHQKAQSLVKQVEKHVTQYDGNKIKISLSYGAYALEQGEQVDTAIARADKAMFEQKRNRKSSE